MIATALAGVLRKRSGGMGAKRICEISLTRWEAWYITPR